MTAARHLIPVSTVADMLAGRIAALAAELLPSGRREGHEWRAGSVAGERGDSLGVHLSGAKAGVWSDFSTGECGDALDLVAAVLFRGDKRLALTWSRRWLGLDSAEPGALATARAEAERGRTARDDAGAADRARTRGNALAMWLSAAPNLRGTPVEAYLRGRGIDLAALERQPRALRYHPTLWHQPSGSRWPAMVAAVTNLAGEHVATHRTWLAVQPDGSVTKAPVTPAKMVLGGYAGACVRVWRGASGLPLRRAAPGETVDITEGIEDALSVAVAAPETRVLAAVSLSNIGGVQLPEAVRAVRLWLQNDDTNAALLAADRAVSAHLRAGRRVLLPEIPRGFKDVNDMLRGCDE